MSPQSKMRTYIISKQIFDQTCDQLSIKKELLTQCIEHHWIEPATPEADRFDEEDLARIQLIRELKEDFGVNDESIPIILHLLDQLYYLQIISGQFRKAS
jgi:chaperone modulatory protein CbpM